MSISQSGVKSENLHEVIKTIKLQNFLTLKKLKEPKEEAVKVCVAIVVIYLDTIDKEKLSEKVVRYKEGVNAELWKAYSKSAVHLFRAISNTLGLIQSNEIKPENVAFAKRIVKGLTVDKFAPKNSIDEHVNNMLKFIKDFVRFYENHMRIRLEDYDTFSFYEVYQNGGLLIYNSSLLPSEYNEVEDESINVDAKPKVVKQNSIGLPKKQSSIKFSNNRRNTALLSVEAKISDNLTKSQESLEKSNKLSNRVYSNTQKVQATNFTKPPVNFSQKNISSKARKPESKGTIDIDLGNLKVASHVELEDISMPAQNDESHMHQNNLENKPAEIKEEDIVNNASEDSNKRLETNVANKDIYFMTNKQKPNIQESNMSEFDSKPTNKESENQNSGVRKSEVKLSMPEENYRSQKLPVDSNYKSGYNTSDFLKFESKRSNDTLDRFQSIPESNQNNKETVNVAPKETIIPNENETHKSSQEELKIIKMSSSEKNEVIYGSKQRNSTKESRVKNIMSDFNTKIKKKSRASNFNNQVKNLYSNRKSNYSSKTDTLVFSSKGTIQESQAKNTDSLFNNVASEHVKELNKECENLPDPTKHDVHENNESNKAKKDEDLFYEIEINNKEDVSKQNNKEEPHSFEKEVDYDIEQKNEEDNFIMYRPENNENGAKEEPSKSIDLLELSEITPNNQRNSNANNIRMSRNSANEDHYVNIIDDIKKDELKEEGEIVQNQDENNEEATDVKIQEPLSFYPSNNEMLIIDQSCENIERTHEVTNIEDDLPEIKIRKPKKKTVKTSLSANYQTKTKKPTSVQKTKKEPTSKLRLKSQNIDRISKMNSLRPPEKNLSEFPHKKNTVKPKEKTVSKEQKNKRLLPTQKSRPKSTKVDIDRKLFNYQNKPENKTKIIRTVSANLNYDKKSKIKGYIKDQENRKNYMKKRENYFSKDYREIREEQQNVAAMRLEAKRLKHKLDKQAREKILDDIKNKENDMLEYTKDFMENNKIAKEESERNKKKFIREMKDENWKEHKFVKELKEESELEKKKKELLEEKKMLEKTLEILKDNEDIEKTEQQERKINFKHDRKVKEAEEQRLAELENNMIKTRKELDLAYTKKNIQDLKSNWEKELKFYENFFK